MRWPILLLIVGCGGQPASGRDTNVSPEPRTLTVSPPTLADGVIAMEPLCAEGAEERCDGVDSDCDAHIDEGCDGVVNGAVEIVATWNTGNDIDLIVHGPGEPWRGTSRADCGHPPEARLERTVFQTPLAGEYHVELDYAGPCGVSDGPIQASVSVTALGTSVGIFNRALGPGDPVPIVSFTIE